MIKDPGEVKERWIVLWFSPNEDGRRVFVSEARARAFARSYDIEDWNPILERQTVTTVSEVMKL